MGPVQEGRVRNALPGGDPGLGNARVGVEKHGLKLFPGLVQGAYQTLFADDYAGIIEVTLVEAGPVLAIWWRLPMGWNGCRCSRACWRAARHHRYNRC